MSSNIVQTIRTSSPNFSSAILKEVTVERAARQVEINLITDKAFTVGDRQSVEAALKPFVPEYFTYKLNISKLTPDCEMVKRKIIEAININFKAVFATLNEDDITVEKTQDGFAYSVAVMGFMASGSTFCEKITEYLQSCFCGNFAGSCLTSTKRAEDIEVEEKVDEIEFEVPIRRFRIADFEYLEGTKKQENAIYIADLNFAGNEVVICGTIEDIRERTYKNKNGIEKKYYNFIISDSTGNAQVTYFVRQKSYEKIKCLKVGDSVVCTGSNEEFRGSLRYTANVIDYGNLPAGFVPERRESKPVPMYYHVVKPQPFSDVEQTDFLTKQISIPDCLKSNSFVVFDLETTGLNSSPVTGNMDRIIEIGAYKIENGEISQCFSTFVNPQKKLSDEIIKLTGITEDMVASAPTYEEVMPDFFKFCAGSILVGHNVAGFDFKFVDYYCTRLGYILERKIIDTIPLSQELLFLSNYKLNTVADRFNVTFNHHRATDDALATAKIFIELIKLKKSLPRL